MFSSVLWKMISSKALCCAVAFAHVKRRDVLQNWFATVLQVIHWFNPLVWLGFARWRADRELACDALALETAGVGTLLLTRGGDGTHLWNARGRLPGKVTAFSEQLHGNRQEFFEEPSGNNRRLAQADDTSNGHTIIGGEPLDFTRHFGDYELVAETSFNPNPAASAVEPSSEKFGFELD